MTQSLPKRSEVPQEFTWDVTSVYRSDQEWEAAIQQLEAQLAGLPRFQGHLADGPATLADWLQQSADLYSLWGKIYVYAGLFYDVETTNPAAVAKSDRAQGLYARAAATTAFAEPEMLAIGFETLGQWAQTEPRLAIYAHYFDELRRRQAHVRSAEVEELLGQASEPLTAAARIHGVMTDADLTFRPAQGRDTEPMEVAQGTIYALLTSPDRTVRQTAWQNYADAFLAHKHSMAACMAAGVKQNVFLARVRRYGSALEAALTASHLPVAVFHSTVETFQHHLSIWHRYWRARRQALGYDRLHGWDIRAPLSTNKPHVPFDQAMTWIVEGMRPLGAEYVEAMRRGVLEQRWVDIYPNQGKTAGAFSGGTQGTYPFILMSHTDDLLSLSTLAHELGHSMHSYYTWQTQPPIYAGYSNFVAEVASNFNQALVRAYLFDRYPERDFQLAVIDEAMSNFHRYFFTMPTLARFELAMHQQVERGEALTAEGLINLMADLYREGYGGEVEMDDQRMGSTWAQFSHHLYMNFYVFQYTTGIAAAHALAAGVLAGEPGAAERYLSFLKAGSSLYPLDALKLAGVDMTTPEPMEKGFAVLEGLVDRLERLTGS